MKDKEILQAINYAQLIQLDKRELYKVLEKSKFNTNLIFSRLRELYEDEKKEKNND